jgi:glycosyltransferase involved in cell wall biosynthesis
MFSLLRNRLVAPTGRRRRGPSGRSESFGSALFSYLADPLAWDRKDARLSGHSNKWESREIARLIAQRGYEIEAIEWSDRTSLPSGPFKLLFDIHGNLPRFAAAFPDARKLMHLTGSYNPFQNRAEKDRIAAFKNRRGMAYMPRRQILDLDSYIEALNVADACSLIGNECTLSTYPEDVRGKITPVTVSASWPLPVKKPHDFVPKEREFLWFAGGGCVLKGLDLAIEAFAANPDVVLNIVGDTDEQEIVQSYRKELALANIRRHGPLDPGGIEFRSIVNRCIAFVAPSASEGISPASASCMLIGLYPIISRNTGLTLPKGAGTYLQSCSVEEIQSAALSLRGMSSAAVRELIILTQAEAKARYSRRAFTEQMSLYLNRAMGLSGKTYHKRIPGEWRTIE